MGSGSLEARLISNKQCLIYSWVFVSTPRGTRQAYLNRSGVMSKIRPKEFGRGSSRLIFIFEYSNTPITAVEIRLGAIH